MNFSADIAAAGQEVWMLEGDCTVYPAQPPIGFGNLNQATAHWLSASTLAWPGVPNAGSYKLYYAANGGLGSDTGGVRCSASRKATARCATPPTTAPRACSPSRRP